MSIETVLRFAQLGLSAPILQTIEEIGYEIPSPIQAEAIPPLLEGHDLVGQAQTGTGKTAAFVLPMLSRIDLSVAKPQALILAPTRELAIQVAEAIQAYARHLPGLHVLPVYGGQPISTQLRPLRRGVHVVVGTPGRIIDHLKRKTLALGALKMVILDEADEMLKMGFIDDVELILQHTPKEKQVALFSATMPDAVRKIARRHLRDPIEIKIKSKTATVSTVSQFYCKVTGLYDKLDRLTRILETSDFEAMLVFARTKNATVELTEKLEARGYNSAALNGDMNQNAREQTIQRLKSGKLDIVVATDVAARGLDVSRISHVVNFDIPTDTESYVHRIGRTGRAGRQGQAILFVHTRERRLLRAIEDAIGQAIDPLPTPSLQDVTDRRVSQFKQAVATILEDENLAFFEQLIDQWQQEPEADLRKMAAALAFLAQRDRPLQPDFAEAKSSKSPKSSRTSTSAPDQGSSTRSSVSPARQKDLTPGMSRYRLEVGREHGVQVKDIVGAIANEAGVKGSDIGQIALRDTYSLVDLPDGMPKPILQLLKKVSVCGQPLKLRLLEPRTASAKSAMPRKSVKKKPTFSAKSKSGKSGKSGKSAKSMKPGTGTHRKGDGLKKKKPSKG